MHDPNFIWIDEFLCQWKSYHLPIYLLYLRDRGLILL